MKNTNFMLNELSIKKVLIPNQGLIATLQVYHIAE